MDTMLIQFLLDETSYKGVFFNLISQVLAEKRKSLFDFKHVSEMPLNSNDAVKVKSLQLSQSFSLQLH